MGKIFRNSRMSIYILIRNSDNVPLRFGILSDYLQ